MQDAQTGFSCHSKRKGFKCVPRDMNITWWPLHSELESKLTTQWLVRKSLASTIRLDKKGRGFHPCPRIKEHAWQQFSTKPALPLNTNSSDMSNSDQNGQEKYAYACIRQVSFKLLQQHSNLYWYTCHNKPSSRCVSRNEES